MHKTLILPGGMQCALTRSLALSSTQRLMDHNARIGERVALALHTTPKSHSIA